MSLKQSDCKTGRIKDIEIIRAVSIVFVILAHHKILLFWQFSPNQHSTLETFNFSVGVDFFLVASGFVISRAFAGNLFAREFSNKRNFNLKSFWIRRFWRLAPTAWLWIAIGTLLSFYFNESEVFGPKNDVFSNALACLLNIMNFRTAFLESRGGTAYAFSVFWSLSLEEQFYFILPVAIFLLRTRDKILAASIAVILVQFLIFNRSSNL